MNRTIDLLNVFAANAETDIPAYPIAGTGYRNEEITDDAILNGWEFNKKVESADHNQLMFIITSLVQQLAQQSILSWCATTAYKRGGKAVGSDGKAYKAVIDNVNVDPTTVNDAATWKVDTGDTSGKFVEFATDVAPAGYLVCDGSAVSRAKYPELFAAIGIKWGAGDGGTTFNLPDARGEFLRGFDAGRNVDPGRVFGTSQAESFKSHVHNIDFAGHTSADATNGGNIASGFNGLEGITAFDTQATGGTETRPRNIPALICVAI